MAWHRLIHHNNVNMGSQAIQNCIIPMVTLNTATPEERAIMDTILEEYEVECEGMHHNWVRGGIFMVEVQKIRTMISLIQLSNLSEATKNALIIPREETITLLEDALAFRLSQ